MLKPPPLKNALQYPVTAGVGLAAAAVTGWWWSAGNIHALLTDESVWEKWEVWRAFSSTLPHVSLLHLGFNLYWLWVFGTVLERVYGPWRVAAIYLLLAFGS